MKIPVRVKALILLAVAIYCLARVVRGLVTLLVASPVYLSPRASSALARRRSLKSCSRC